MLEKARRRIHTSGNLFSDLSRFLSFLWNNKGKGPVSRMFRWIADHARREGGLR